MLPAQSDTLLRSASSPSKWSHALAISREERYALGAVLVNQLSVAAVNSMPEASCVTVQ